MKPPIRRRSAKKNRSKPSVSERHLARDRKVIPRSNREQETRTRALNALAHMRREHLLLAAASRLEHVKASTVLRHVGSAVRHDKVSGRYRATKGDRFRRDLQIPTEHGPMTISVYGSKNAEKVSKYLNAIGHYLRRGDQAKLRRFKSKTLKVGKQRIKLLTDPESLSIQADADQLHLDQLYASRTGRS